MHALHGSHESIAPDPDDLAALGKLNPFSTLRSSGLSKVTRRARTHVLPARTALLDEGSRAEVLYVVLDGCVELYGHANGREATTAIVRAGGMFDLSASVLDVPHLVSARTCAASRVMTVPAKDMRAASRHDVTFAHGVTLEIADRYRTEVEALMNIKLRLAVERLAAWLLQHESVRDGQRSLELPCNKRVLASLLAMSPENLSRALAALGANGIVVAGRTITVTDRAALTAIARPESPSDERHERRRGGRNA